MSRTNHSTDVTNALRQIRKRADMTQAEAAKKLSISRSLWSALENKKRPLTIALVNRIQVAFNLSDDEVKYIRTWWGDAHLESK